MAHDSTESWEIPYQMSALSHGPRCRPPRGSLIGCKQIEPNLKGPSSCRKTHKVHRTVVPGRQIRYALDPARE